MLAAASDVDPEAIGAFFAGAAAVISSMVSLWLSRKRAEQECERRIEAFKAGMRAAWRK